MNLGQACKLAAKSILAKKGRSALTMLGIIIGLAAVIILVTFAQGKGQKDREYIESLGTNIINIQASTWNSEGMSDALYSYCMDLSDLVIGVTPSVQFHQEASVKYGTKSMGGRDAEGNYDWRNQPQITMGNQQYSLCSNYTVTKGRDLSYLDVKNYAQVCVLGSKTVSALFNYADPIGKSITINGNAFEVIGVFAEKDPNDYSGADRVILLPYTMNRLLNGTNQMDSFVAKARSAEATTKAITLIGGFLEGMLGKEGYYYVQSPDQVQQDFADADKLQQVFLAGIAGISLLVGGIGIMNIMLVTVTERTREIGIRKAIGAERKSIIVQFLIEACMICGIGGIFGILFGFLGTLVVCKIMLNTIIYPDIAITLGSFAFSVVLGIVFGLYPAIKASGLQPVVALRAE